MMGVNPVSDASSSGRSNQRKGRYHERQNGKKLGELTGFTFQLGYDWRTTVREGTQMAQQNA